MGLNEIEQDYESVNKVNDVRALNVNAPSKNRNSSNLGQEKR